MANESDPNRPKQANMIDDNLRKAYKDIVDADVPERFTDLLAQLRQQETADKSDK